MTKKTISLSKILRQMEKEMTGYWEDPYVCGSPFVDLKDYKEFIKDQLELTRNSHVYVFDMEKKKYIDNFYKTLNKYTDKNISIQLDQSWFIGAEGDYNVTILIITVNK